MQRLKEETRKVLLDILKGDFKKPVKDRTRTEKNALVLFWRNKDNLTIGRTHGRDSIFFKGKEVLTKEDLRQNVKRTFRKAKGTGARPLTHTLKKQYTGVSEKVVRGLLKEDLQHGYAQAKFTNKAPMKSVSASRVFERVQVDLVRMTDQAVQQGGRTFKYILTVVDILSRFVFLKPLENKSAKHVAKELELIFREHGFPQILQSDNGTEFLGAVRRMLGKGNVKIINSRPYHPQSQGKVERQNRIVREKIRFALRRSRSGYNWVEGLPKIAASMNAQPKPVLGHQTPHSVYFGRGDGVSADKIRQKAKSSSDRYTRQLISKHWKVHGCTLYSRGDKVLVRYPSGCSRVPQRRHVLKAIIRKRGLQFARYYTSFKTPEGKLLQKWVRVEDITSRTAREEQTRRAKSKNIMERLRRKEHRRQFYIIKNTSDELDDVPSEAVESDTPVGGEDTHTGMSGAVDPTRHLETTGAGNRQQTTEKTRKPKKPRFFAKNKRVIISFDPVGDGSCQFGAVAHQLLKLGVHTTKQKLRHLAVTHLQYNRESYVDFVETDGDSGTTWTCYIGSMSKPREYGDGLTLLAIAREYNCQFFVLSSLGDDRHRLVSNTDDYRADVPLLTLGFYPEDKGNHYVSVEVERSYLDSLKARFSPVDIALNVEREHPNAAESRDPGMESPAMEVVDVGPTEPQSSSDVEEAHQVVGGDSPGPKSAGDVEEAHQVVGGDSPGPKSAGDVEEAHQVVGGDSPGPKSAGDVEEAHQVVGEDSPGPMSAGDVEEAHQVVGGDSPGPKTAGDVEEAHQVVGGDSSGPKSAGDVEEAHQVVGGDSSGPLSVGVVEREVEAIEGEDSLAGGCHGQRRSANEAEVSVPAQENNGVAIPDLVMNQIIRTTVRMYPFMLYILRRVSPYFDTVTRSIGRSEMYFPPGVIQRVPLALPVRRLYRLFGRTSGVVEDLRHLFRGAGPRWIHAWLHLQELGDNWAQIVDIDFR